MRSASSLVVLAATACLAGPAPPAAAAGGAFASPPGAGAAPPDADGTPASAAAEFAALVRAILAPSFAADWRGIEALKQVDWAPLPPKSLRDCLPDGGCHVRQGTAYLGGRPFGVLASGGRGLVTHFHLRNAGEPVGGPAVLAALRREGLAPEPVRCPAAASGPGAGGTSGYRVAGPGAGPGVVSIQTSCDGRPCEGYVVSPGSGPPPLPPSPPGLRAGRCGTAAAADGRRE